jgi:hypothetical protein
MGLGKTVPVRWLEGAVATRRPIFAQCQWFKISPRSTDAHGVAFLQYHGSTGRVGKQPRHDYPKRRTCVFQVTMRKRAPEPGRGTPPPCIFIPHCDGPRYDFTPRLQRDITTAPIPSSTAYVSTLRVRAHYRDQLRHSADMTSPQQRFKLPLKLPAESA